MKSPSTSPAGELLMLRLVAPCWSSSLERQLQELEPGGILLAGPLPHSPDTLYELLGGISRSLPAPPILALEAEGGADPLNVLLPRLPSPRAAAEKGVASVGRLGELIGEALNLLGLNTCFAPILDLTSPFTEKTLCGNTFGGDPHGVAQCGAAFVQGLSRHKILACGRHFPGLASVPPVGDKELPISGRSMADLWRSDLVPYRELLSQLPLVLMSTAAYKAYDPDYPCSAALSAGVVGGLLRAKLGYRGVVVAPHLESQPIRGALDFGRAAIQSLSAGCDILLVEKDESWQAMRRRIDEDLASGELSRERLEQSVGRIRALKKGWSPPKGPFSSKAWGRLARSFEEFKTG
jgi:beta-N-acetylhexosaminidase